MHIFVNIFYGFECYLNTHAQDESTICVFSHRVAAVYTNKITQNTRICSQWRDSWSSHASRRHGSAGKSKHLFRCLLTCMFSIHNLFRMFILFSLALANFQAAKGAMEITVVAADNQGCLS